MCAYHEFDSWPCEPIVIFKTAKFHIFVSDAYRDSLDVCQVPKFRVSNFFQELSYAGVQRLLGFVCTVGTVSEALPPPTSSLISSFLLPHNPNV